MATGSVNYGQGAYPNAFPFGPPKGSLATNLEAINGFISQYHNMKVQQHDKSILAGVIDSLGISESKDKIKEQQSSLTEASNDTMPANFTTEDWENMDTGQLIQKVYDLYMQPDQQYDLIPEVMAKHLNNESGGIWNIPVTQLESTLLDMAMQQKMNQKSPKENFANFVNTINTIQGIVAEKKRVDLENERVALQKDAFKLQLEESEWSRMFEENKWDFTKDQTKKEFEQRLKEWEFTSNLKESEYYWNMTVDRFNMREATWQREYIISMAATGIISNNEMVAKLSGINTEGYTKEMLGRQHELDAMRIQNTFDLLDKYEIDLTTEQQAQIVSAMVLGTDPSKSNDTRSPVTTGAQEILNKISKIKEEVKDPTTIIDMDNIMQDLIATLRTDQYRNDPNNSILGNYVDEEKIPYTNVFDFGRDLAKDRASIMIDRLKQFEQEARYTGASITSDKFINEDDRTAGTYADLYNNILNDIKTSMKWVEEYGGQTELIPAVPTEQAVKGRVLLNPLELLILDTLENKIGKQNVVEAWNDIPVHELEQMIRNIKKEKFSNQRYNFSEELVRKVLNNNYDAKLNEKRMDLDSLDIPRMNQNLMSGGNTEYNNTFYNAGNEESFKRYH